MFGARPAPEGGPRIGVLLCTYNGRQYLSAQLNSIRVQTTPSWHLWVSDDGSSDQTDQILRECQAAWGQACGRERISILIGPSQGLVANFLRLVCDPAIEADYYAYADQDDIWEPHKLERAVGWLETVPESVPALYCSRTKIIDETGKEVGLSPLFTRKPSFSNALVQNIAGGNTMVFNNAARDILRRAGMHVNVVIHDWWTYLAVAGCGGRVFYDSHPTVRYRWHKENQIGPSFGFRARVSRLKRLWEGRFRDWNSINATALKEIQDYLTPENLETLNRFLRARDCWLVPRLIEMKRARVYRQTLLGNASLIVAAILKKL